MAKELDWKSSKAATPRGFESHVLRQNKTLSKCSGFLIFTEILNTLTLLTFLKDRLVLLTIPEKKSRIFNKLF